MFDRSGENVSFPLLAEYKHHEELSKCYKSVAEIKLSVRSHEKRQVIQSQ
jgi:hypothetical protein